jgi:hypothetical protein
MHIVRYCNIDYERCSPLSQELVALVKEVSNSVIFCAEEVLEGRFMEKVYLRVLKKEIVLLIGRVL